MNAIEEANQEFLESFRYWNPEVFDKVQGPELEERFNNYAADLPKNISLRLNAEYFGDGPLEEIILDEAITEIVINGPKEIYYEKRSKWHQTQDYFLSQHSYQNFILRLCEEAGFNFTKEHPFLCGKWRHFRVHITEASIAGNHSLCLRRHPTECWNFSKLLDLDWASDESLEVLLESIDQKNNLLIVGPTGSGKTSAINACLQHIDIDERIVILEDADELQIPNPLSTKLLTRSSFESKLEPVDLSDLVKQSLRMRPDRLVLGEVRGAEAKDLLMALATGHKGSIASLHADTAKEAILRLEMLIQLGAPNWCVEAIRRLIHLSIDKIVVLNKKNGTHHLDSIWNIASVESFGLILQEVTN